MSFRVNGAARIRVEQPRGIPVLLIEDFYENPDEVRERALRADYSLAIAQYPGRHAPIPSDELGGVFAILADVMTRVGDRRYSAADFFSDFSVITSRPEDLLPVQRHPHIDPTPVLGLVYLTPGSREGTSFYFNRILGTERISTPEQSAAHVDFLERHGAALAPAGYGLEGSEVWERFYTIEPLFNRFVMYPGNVFHAIDIVHVDDTVDLRTARVTQRLIVQRTHEK